MDNTQKKKADKLTRRQAKLQAKLRKVEAKLWKIYGPLLQDVEF